MADSYHIIDGKVVPYSGGRKCNDTDAWRDATPLELQLQEQLAEYEHANAAQKAEIETLRAEVDGWKAQHSRDSAELRRLCQHRDEYKARADRLAEALRDAHEALADAANTMYAIFGESQFCYSCNAFERANQWRQDWHGGDPLLQQITAALEQESNDA